MGTASNLFGRQFPFHLDTDFHLILKQASNEWRTK